MDKEGTGSGASQESRDEDTKGHVAEMARFSREEKWGKGNDTQGIETFRIGDGVRQPE